MSQAWFITVSMSTPDRSAGAQRAPGTPQTHAAATHLAATAAAPDRVAPAIRVRVQLIGHARNKV